MHPELFQIGPITLYSYGLLVALAFLVGTFWVCKRVEAAGENLDHYLYAILWIILVGFACARLLYVFYFPDMYLQDPVKIFIDRGGFVWYGGLVGAFIASLVYVRVKKISLPKFGDILVVPAALGLAIGRVGCFMTGCCYGNVTHVPWGVQFPAGHESHPHLVHPTQLYEAGALILLVFVLQAIYRRSRTAGVTTAMFFIGYGVIRFIIEYLRGDVIYWVGNIFTASQVFSLVCVVGGIVTLLLLRRRRTAGAAAENHSLPAAN